MDGCIHNNLDVMRSVRDWMGVQNSRGVGWMCNGD